MRGYTFAAPKLDRRRGRLCFPWPLTRREEILGDQAERDAAQAAYRWRRAFIAKHGREPGTGTALARPEDSCSGFALSNEMEKQDHGGRSAA